MTCWRRSSLPDVSPARVPNGLRAASPAHASTATITFDLVERGMVAIPDLTLDLARTGDRTTTWVFTTDSGRHPRTRADTAPSGSLGRVIEVPVLARPNAPNAMSGFGYPIQRGRSPVGASDRCRSRTRIAVRDGAGEHDADNAQLDQL